MPPSNERDHSDWLRRARSSLALSKAGGAEDVLWEDLSYQAQQAAEKALKAVFVAHGLNFRYTHDVEELLTGLRQQGIKVPRAQDEAAILSQYATETRYPGPLDPVTEEEYRQAVLLAEEVLNWEERDMMALGK